MIYPDENNSNCKDFIVHKDKKITVELLNEDVEKVQIYQVRAVLEDGSTFKALPAFTKSDMWSKKFEMEFCEPPAESWAQIRIGVKLDGHTDEETLIDTKISVLSLIHI